MGFLHKLWDETLAGPAPESGLSKLRKYHKHNSFSDRSAGSHVTGGEEFPVSRSITVLRSNSNAGSALRNVNIPADLGSGLSSPSTPITPGSPFSPTSPRGDFKKLTRRKSMGEALQKSQPRSPSGYDWIVLSALDR